MSCDLYKINSLVDIECGEDDNSEYFSCLSESEFEDSDDEDDDYNNSDFSLTPIHSNNSNVSSDNESVSSIQHTKMSIDIIKIESPSSLSAFEIISDPQTITRIRSPIDITFPSKLLDRISPHETKTTATIGSGGTQNTISKKSILKSLRISAETKFRKPIAPIIRDNDPFFEINKKYDYNLYLSDKLCKTSKLQQHPIASRFFPLGNPYETQLLFHPSYEKVSLSSQKPFETNANTSNNHYHSASFSSSSISKDMSLDLLIGNHRRSSMHF